jgi:hypothetical protein
MTITPASAWGAVVFPASAKSVCLDQAEGGRGEKTLFFTEFGPTFYQGKNSIH